MIFGKKNDGDGHGEEDWEAAMKLQEKAIKATFTLKRYFMTEGVADRLKAEDYTDEFLGKVLDVLDPTYELAMLGDEDAQLHVKGDTDSSLKLPLAVERSIIQELLMRRAAMALADGAEVTL